MKIPKIEYEIYYPLYSNELIKLNISQCKELEIIISNPVILDDIIEKHNPKSDYYNDICFKSASKKGADITLKDRKEEFIDGNMTLCEEDCKLIEYNSTIKKAKCSCLFKISLPIIENIKFDKNKLYKSFIDINNIINIQVVKCYKSVFIFEVLKINYGFYIYNIYISLLFLFFITFFLFYCKYYSIFIKLIQNISKAKNEILKLNNNKKMIITF